MYSSLTRSQHPLVRTITSTVVDAEAKLQVLRRVHGIPGVQHVVLAVQLSHEVGRFSRLLLRVTRTELIVQVESLLLGHHILKLLVGSLLLTSACRVRRIKCFVLFSVAHALILLQVRHLPFDFAIFLEVPLGRDHRLTRIADGDLSITSAI